MADGVTIPAQGTGDTTPLIATDDAGVAGQVQIIKLAIDTNASATLIPATAADGLLVNLGANNDVTVTSGNIAVTGAVTAETELPAAAALADGAANPTTPSVGSNTLVWNGATWDRAPGTAALGITVNTEMPAAAALADGAGNPTAPMVGANLLLWNGVTWDRGSGNVAGGQFMQGNVAHDLPVTQNPVLIGGRASAAAPADVSADGDQTRLWVLRNGAQATVLTAAGALIGGDAANGMDVDVTRVLPGSTALALGKLEDDPHNTGDLGVMMLAVTKATPVALGADGDYAPLQVDATGRQWVRPAPVQLRLQLTPTVSNAVAYASGDVLGTLQTLTSAARVSGGSGVIQSITVLDKTQAQRAAIDLLFFDRTVTVAADNVAVAMSDADMAFCLGIVGIGPYNTAFPGTPLNSLATLLNVGLPFVLNGTDLFVVAVVRGTPTYTSTTDLIFSYVILQD